MFERAEYMCSTACYNSPLVGFSCTLLPTLPLSFHSFSLALALPLSVLLLSRPCWRSNNCQPACDQVAWHSPHKWSWYEVRQMFDCGTLFASWSRVRATATNEQKRLLFTFSLRWYHSPMPLLPLNDNQCKPVVANLAKHKHTNTKRGENKKWALYEQFFCCLVGGHTHKCTHTHVCVCVCACV